MAGGPFDYASPLTTGQLVNPALALQQGQQAASGIVNAQRDTIAFNQAQEDRQRALDAATAKAIQAAKDQLQMRADFDAAAKSGAIADSVANMVRYPQMAEQIKRAVDVMGTTQSEDFLNQITMMTVATKNGEPAVASDMARRDAELWKEKAPQKAEMLLQLADQLDANQGEALSAMQQVIAGVGGKERIEAVQTAEGGAAALKTKQAQADKAAADAAAAAQEAALKTRSVMATILKDEGQVARWEMQSNNEADRLNFDRQKYKDEKAAAQKAAEAGVVEVPKDVRATIEADSSKAVEAAGVARKGFALAKEFTDNGPIGGVLGATRDAIAGVAGIDTNAASKNEQYIELRNQLMRARRKPGEGVYTDADAARDEKAFPGEGASSTAKARALNRLSEEADLSAKLHRAAARFRALTGGPGMSKAPVFVDGVEIPGGSSLGDFTAIMEDHYLAAPTDEKKPAVDPAAAAEAKSFWSNGG